MSIIKPALHHVSLKTTRLDEMIAWYSVAVGASVIYRDKTNAWLTNDAANHRMAFFAVPGLSDDTQKSIHNGMHHSAFEYDTFSDLMSSYMRMSEVGIRPAFCLDHGMTTSLYYKDPDGNFVELQSDKFGDWKLSTEWMHTSPAFAANPVGFFFDPEKTYEAHQTGIDFKALQRAIRAGQFKPVAAPDLGLPVPDRAL